MTATRAKALVDQVLERNPDLAGLAHRIAASRARVPQAGALPDPVVSYGVNNQGLPLPFVSLGRGDFSEVYVGVTQDVPYAGKRALRERVAREDVAVAEFSRDSMQRRIVASVKSMYVELYGLQESADIIDHHRRTLEQIERMAAVRLAVGSTSQQDVLDAEVELSKIEERLSVLARRAVSAQAQLRSVVRLDPEWRIGRLTALDAVELPPLDTLRRLALEQSPDVLGPQQEVTRADVALQLARRELKPDLGANFTYHNRGVLPPYWSFGGTLRLPFYADRKQRQAIVEASETLESARGTVEARRLAMVYQVEDAYAMATTAQRLLRLYDQGILKQARFAIESALTNYQVGKIDFLTTLTSWTRLRDYEVTYYDQVVAYQQALAQLEALTGQELLK
jgi:outer membrane protein TolC